MELKLNSARMRLDRHIVSELSIQRKSKSKCVFEADKWMLDNTFGATWI